MSKNVKWILISVLALVIVLVVLKVTGVIGKKIGTKVTSEKAQKRNIIEIVNAKMPADKSGRERSGSSTCLQTSQGDAPNTAADCL